MLHKIVPLLCIALVACDAPSEPTGDVPSGSVSREDTAKTAQPDAPIGIDERVPKPETADPEGEGPDPTLAGDLPAALSRLAQRYATGWIAASAAFEGELTDAGTQDYQLVLGSAHCVRVLGASEASLDDLDLLLFDPNGVQVQGDQAADRFPVVGLAYPVCPPQPGAYRLQVRATSGAGAVRVQACHAP